MAHTGNLPILSPENGLQHYLQEIRKFPILDADEEYMLAKRWKEHDDTGAAHKLVTSHLRLVAKIAMGYRGYGLPVSDLIAEGNIGLMQSVKKFEPEKGFRLSTYAIWWIKAAIQEYVLRSWSLVKMGTSAAQKKLFFNLRRMKNRLLSYHEGNLSPDQVSEIAEELNVKEQDVVDMDQRMTGGDHSLNSKLNDDSDAEWIDQLETPEDSQETRLLEHQEASSRSELLASAMRTLNEREQDILTRRRLSEPVVTLEDLSQQYGISRERVRQIEVRAFEKLQNYMQTAQPQDEAA